MKRRRILLGLAALVVVPAAIAAEGPPTDDRPLPTRGGYVFSSRIEPKLTAAAVKVTPRRQLEVRCWSREDWVQIDSEWMEWAEISTFELAGYYRRGFNAVQLSPTACASLAGFLYRGRRPTKGMPLHQMADAFRTVTHEAQHARGIRNEARADCYGQQKIRPLAIALGATKAYATLLATHSWRVLRKNLPASYRSAKCRNRGQWDLHPKVSAFP